MNGFSLLPEPQMMHYGIGTSKLMKYGGTKDLKIFSDIRIPILKRPLYHGLPGSMMMIRRGY